jgi:hypothetical protein
MTFRESIETQIRTATERLILFPPSEQTRLSDSDSEAAGTPAREKRRARHNGREVVTSEFRGAT